jgi:hypothetical protein
MVRKYASGPSGPSGPEGDRLTETRRELAEVRRELEGVRHRVRSVSRHTIWNANDQAVEMVHASDLEDALR